MEYPCDLKSFCRETREIVLDFAEITTTSPPLPREWQELQCIMGHFQDGGQTSFFISGRKKSHFFMRFWPSDIKPILDFEKPCIFLFKNSFFFYKSHNTSLFSRLFLNEGDLRKNVCYSNLCGAARALVESNAQNTVRAGIIGHRP